jgi:hypothetical protein
MLPLRATIAQSRPSTVLGEAAEIGARGTRWVRTEDTGRFPMPTTHCHERNAPGTNLKERLRSLGTKVVLPRELLDGLDDLRLLGNDAAHIESKEFDSIGREEIEIGIQFTKEVLKAVFQYSDLLAKLRSLKSAP